MRNRKKGREKKSFSVSLILETTFLGLLDVIKTDLVNFFNVDCVPTLIMNTFKTGKDLNK